MAADRRMKNAYHAGEEEEEEEEACEEVERESMTWRHCALSRFSRAAWCLSAARGPNFRLLLVHTRGGGGREKEVARTSEQ